MKISVHAGHAPSPGLGCGAVGIMDESTAAREIASKLTTLLKCSGIECEDHTVNYNASASNVLGDLANRINYYNPDLAISIHLNASEKESANGIEAYVHKNTTAFNKELADEILYQISSNLPYTNRGLKETTSLYILNHTKCPAILIECGFVTNPYDCEIFDAHSIAVAIVKAILGDNDSIETDDEYMYKIKVSGKYDADTANKVIEAGLAAGVSIRKE